MFRFARLAEKDRGFAANAVSQRAIARLAIARRITTLMKTIKDVLVLISDGTPDKDGDAFRPEFVKFADFVRVSNAFDISKSPFGKVTAIRQDDTRWYADMALFEDVHGTFYPAIGGRRNKDGTIEVFEVALCSDHPNADSRIPFITL